MIRLADFHLDVGSETGGNAQPGAENFQDQRVAAFDEFDAAAQADTQRFEALHFLIVRLNVTDDRADPRRELVQPDEFDFGLASGCHSGSKISWPAGKSMNPAGDELRIAVGELRRCKSAFTFG
jgi:hypothetical protein